MVNPLTEIGLAGFLVLLMALAFLAEFLVVSGKTDIVNTSSLVCSSMMEFTFFKAVAQYKKRLDEKPEERAKQTRCRFGELGPVKPCIA